MTITLVRVGDRLVGKTVSDRWNLITLGIGTLTHSRNQADVKRARRLTGNLGLSITVERGGLVEWETTALEKEALGDYARAA